MRASFQRMAPLMSARAGQGAALTLPWMPDWMRSSTRGTAGKIVGRSAVMSSVSFLTSPCRGRDPIYSLHRAPLGPACCSTRAFARQLLASVFELLRMHLLLRR